MNPGWQTAELDEEWVERDPENASGRHLCKLTLDTDVDEEETRKDLKLYQRGGVNASLSAMKTGTVVVHGTDEMITAPRIPLAQRMGLLTKNMFSPLKLETMFEPPEDTRPYQPSESPPAWSLDEQKPFTFSSDPPDQKDFRFTFCPPRAPTPPGLSTPDHDANKSKLRLFQFNYDAYTREHLSALIEAIPLDSSSHTLPDDGIFPRKRDSDSTSPIYRPHKRIKISPKEDEDGPTRPPKYGNLLKRVARTPYRTPARSFVMEVIEEAKLQPHNSPTAYRSTASSTVNASESSRSLTGEELALKMRQVALVTQEETNVGSSQHSQARRVSNTGPGNKHISTTTAQQRFPSATTNMTHIGPTDISPLPDQIGVMEFDRAALRWVRRAGEESDDPFRDLESVREGQTQKQVELSLDPDEQHPIELLTGLADEDVAEDSPVSSPNMRLRPLSAAQGPSGMVTPIANRFSSKTAPTPIRSALKRVNMATPRDDRVREPCSSSGKLRSVSFSDGRRHGRIRGLHAEEEDESTMENIAAVVPSDHEDQNSMQPSLRTKRITEMLDDLDNLSQEDEDLTPCKSSHQQQQRSMVESQLGSSTSLHMGNSFSIRSAPNRSTRAKDATFLTECSFGVAHDKLLQALTDVQPFEPHWEELAAVDLSGKALDSVARLREFMPKLEELVLNENRISWLSGVPARVRLLSAVSNLLTGLTSYGHLSHLECLDISDNQIESLLQLECLHRLRELRADRNQIGSLGGVGKLVKLKKLSVSDNCLTHADLFDVSWDELEYLDLSKNRLEVVRGLDRLQGVAHVNLDDNALTGLELGGPMRSLRILRLSDNQLTGTLDVRKMSQLRVLYADRNRLSGLGYGETLTRLERLSLRSQSGEGLVVKAKDVREVRRLYLSGNDLGSWSLDAPCYNLQYVELADCKLTRIPKTLGEMAPNVRVLNLNHNFLEGLQGLEGMRRLRKLSVIGSRIRTSKELVRAVRGLDELEMAEFRMNPCTVSWYVPLLEDGGALDRGDLDAKFRRRLPDELYAGRLVYRGLMMKTCSSLKMLDGVPIGTGERTKAYALLERASGGGVKR